MEPTLTRRAASLDSASVDASSLPGAVLPELANGNRHEQRDMKSDSAKVFSSRREFLQFSTAALAGAAFTPLSTKAEPAASTAAPADRLLWGNLLHLSYNMWCDRRPSSWGSYKRDQLHYVQTADSLRFDDSLWRDLTDKMSKAGLNLVVIDLGDAIRYESHPEIAVRGAWTPARLREELARLRSLGLEPIPKLNFSTAHDAWLHDYSRMVSTPVYYKVCAELVTEVSALFGKPRFFHLGYDEETAAHQSQYLISIVRQHELWWHDFEFFVKTVTDLGVRPWIWSDFAWKHEEDFYAKMPKHVLQSNWYYGLRFDKVEDPMIKTFRDLDQHGFDQVPTGSNWTSPENFGKLVNWCRQEISPARLKGFLQTPWKPTLEEFRRDHLAAIDQVAEMVAKSPTKQ